ATVQSFAYLSDNLYTLNTSTAAATLVGTTENIVLMPAYELANDRLLGVALARPDVWEIDPSDASITKLTAFTPGSSPGDAGAGMGNLVFDCSRGKLFHVQEF